MLKPVAELGTLEEACRSLPSYGSEWDAAIAFGIDVTLLERNLRMTPAERIRHLDEINRWRAGVRARTLSAGEAAASAQETVDADLAAYGPERDR